ncbi:hypothetical protein SERLA73DRAFT_187764 [Serpula lacrymans var. lacrymans S7.3]|uniref:Uncharacterized protein n=2 Tax=Serpula lacrymans var. lacrymans TaxID=341189 RepID=F8QAB7_SERL3|nr:uncharacterized protein SERLADRAFT_477551 [Serpula lacrymans var. lacrymans S7.9]EGN94707.1 hypothetical protein SERLA73DRAFT_187764 [Serpula lacrymans var. lacrymans S7.3]EGO20186.1 hypothetical protein SERLADRAFT_477551 [Serpula lacrymans var. lacrymans S7.9]
MRLPSYRSSYVLRYHPYPTRSRPTTRSSMDAFDDMFPNDMEFSPDIDSFTYGSEVTRTPIIPAVEGREPDDAISKLDLALYPGPASQSEAIARPGNLRRRISFSDIVIDLAFFVIHKILPLRS